MKKHLTREYHRTDQNNSSLGSKVVLHSYQTVWLIIPGCVFISTDQR